MHVSYITPTLPTPTYPTPHPAFRTYVQLPLSSDAMASTQKSNPQKETTSHDSSAARLAAVSSFRRAFSPYYNTRLTHTP